MRGGLAAIAFVATLAIASTARAQELPPGFELGARLGYGLPLGDVDTRQALKGTVGDPLGETIRNMVPIWIDAGYRLAPRWFAGLFFAYAPGAIGGALYNACGPAMAKTGAQNVDCSVFDVRAGAEVHYHVAPGKLWDPWLGAGLGYEWLHLGFSTGFAPSTETWASGFELIDLQAGLDVAVGTRVHLGPFAALTTAVYSWNDTLPSSSTFSSPALHEWVVLGVRGAIDLAPGPPDRPKPDSAD
jgi:hypothetical protein